LGKDEVIIMNTAIITVLSENIIYTPQQVGSVGSFPIFAFPDLSIPIIEDIFSKKTAEEQKIEGLTTPLDIDILELSKKYFEEHKASLIKRYKGKYIAILNNKVVGSEKDFSKLAQRIYKKYSYQTIYMPFIEEKEKIVKIPSPRVRIL